MALLKYTGDIDLSRNGILDILKIQGPDFYEGLSNNLEITTKDETGEKSGSLILRSGSSNSNTTVGNVYLFAGSYTDLSKIKEIKGITLTTSRILLNHDKVETTTNTLVRTIADGGTTEFVEEIYSAEENNKTKGYSATANTKYDITSNNSTALKNKKLTITAGPSISYQDALGYYKLEVPGTTTAEKSAEYIDNVNVRNLFSQTAGDFKLGDNSNNTVSKISSIILNSNKLSSDIGTSTSLTSPEIVIEAQDSSEKGKILVTSPNGFSLEVDNTNSDASKHVSKLTIKDIEATNSTTAKGTIDLGDSTSEAAINVPKSLTVNAVEFTLNQVDSNNNVVDNSLASKGSAILTSKLGTDNKDTATFGKRIASLNVENATVNKSLVSSALTTLNGRVEVNKDKSTGTLNVGGTSSNIQSNAVTLGTSAKSKSILNTFIETQTSDITSLVESVRTNLIRTLGDDKVIEMFDSEGYFITTDTPFTLTGKSTNTINVENGSLSVTGPSNYGLTLNSSTAKEVLKELELSQSYNQTAGEFTIASDSSRTTSVKVYSSDTVFNSTKLTVDAGSGNYAYSLTVDKDNSKSSLSVRDATFNNSVSVATTLTLKNDGFTINAEGNTTLTAKKNFEVEGSNQTDAILSSTLSGSTRTTSLIVENGTFKTELKSNTKSTLSGTTEIRGTTLTVDASTTDLLSSTLNVGSKNKGITSLNAYITAANLTGTTLSETLDTSITRDVANKTFVETIKSTGITLNSAKSYNLNAYASFNIHAGGNSISYPLSISADTSSSRIKATYLEATDYATVKNHVDLGDIRIKYDSSSQSLIFGAV